MNDEELVQISKFLPEVKDRYYINKKGELYTDYGKKKMKDSIKDNYVKNGLMLNNNKTKSFFRHRLVMLCFEPRKDADQLQVNHKDGNKLNNCYDNLEWTTQSENINHAFKLGLITGQKDEQNPMSKLLESQIIDIINDLLNHVPYSTICAKYNCSKSTILAIKNKRNWTYLTKNIKFD